VYDHRKDDWKPGGDKGEGHVFHALQKVLEDDPEGSADLIILHELHVGNIWARDLSGKKVQITKEQEHDFFVVSSNRKLFGPLEVKTTLTRPNHTKAAKQLQKCQLLIESSFWDVLENDGWQFCSSVFFVNQNSEKICDTKCDKWTLFQTSDFGVWWNNMKKQFPVIDEKEQAESRQKALHVISMMLFTIHAKLPTTTSRSIETITDVMEKVSTVDNILFWTKDQINLLKGSGNENILFRSIYGSGKSILLRSKCEQEAEKNLNEGLHKKCLYIVGGRYPTRKYTLLHLALREHWANPAFAQNIQLLSIYELMVSKEIISCIRYM